MQLAQSWWQRVSGHQPPAWQRSWDAPLWRRTRQLGVLAVLAFAALIPVASEPDRLLRLTPATLSLSLPLMLLVTLRRGTWAGILSGILASFLAPSLIVRRLDLLVGNQGATHLLLTLGATVTVGSVLALGEIDRRRAARERGSLRETQALLSTAERLNASTDPEEMLRQAVQAVADALSVHRIVVYTNETDFALVRYRWTDGQYARGQTRVPIEDSPAGWVIRRAQAYRSTSGASKSGASTRVGRSTGDGEYVPRYVLAVPIQRGGAEVRGVLSLFDRVDGKQFSDADQRLAEAMAHHVAIALDRAGLIQDLSRSQEQLRLQASSDALTGLPNRRFFMDRVALALAPDLDNQLMPAVLLLDLDGFKLVNDSLGHAAGDELLQEVGYRLRETVRRPADLVARLAGDEFALLIGDVTDEQQAMSVARRVSAVLRRPFQIGGHQITVTASAGIALREIAGPTRTAEDLLREAGLALHSAKESGRDRAVVFSPVLSAMAIGRLEIENELRVAIRRDELRLHYQPIVELASGRIVGMEALVRWQHPTRGLLLPARFISVAEQTGLIAPLGHWVLTEACREAQAWHDLTWPDPPPRVNVNVSARQLENAELVNEIAQVLRDTGLPPRQLEVELTETSLTNPLGPVRSTLDALRRLGVTVAVDDFGTGYSSLSYLERLAVDRLKIDRAFMRNLRHGSSSAAIVAAILALAQALGREVVAEGIETEEQLEHLLEMGCLYGQGYYFERPLTQADTRRLLSSTGPRRCS